MKFFLYLILIGCGTCIFAVAPVAAQQSSESAKTVETLPPSRSVADNQQNRAPWHRFGDSVLNELIQRALKENLNIHATRARIDQAEAAARLAFAPLLPSVQAEGMYSISSYNSPIASISVPGITMPDTPSYIHRATGTLKATYVVDITGRYYKARQAALKEVDALDGDIQSQAVAISILVWQTYYDVVAAKMRVELLNQQIANYENLLSLVMAQFKVGSATALDVLQQRAQLEAKKALLPLAKSIIESGKYQLAALLADTVDSLPTITAALPELSGFVPKEDMENILTVKPELRAAKQRVDALELREKSTKRALLPSLALNAQVGIEASHLSDSKHYETWSVGAVLSIPIYMGGANWASLRQAEAATLSAKYGLENSVLESKTKIFAAKAQEAAQREYFVALSEQTKAAKQTVQEATRRYVAGLSSYLNVLTANDVLQLNELNLLQAKRTVLSARINLLEAIGGKWTQQLVAK